MRTEPAAGGRSKRRAKHVVPPRWGAPVWAGRPGLGWSPCLAPRHRADGAAVSSRELPPCGRSSHQAPGEAPCLLQQPGQPERLWGTGVAALRRGAAFDAARSAASPPSPRAVAGCTSRSP